MRGPGTGWTLWAIVGLALGGCGAAPPGPTPAPSSSGLVVVREADVLRTRWVDQADGRVLATFDGALFAEGAALFRWAVEEVEVPLWDELPEAEAPDPRTAERRGVMRRASLVPLAGGASVIEVVQVDPALVARDVSHEVSLEVAFDAWVIVSETLYVDAFGAHGAAIAEQHVVSLLGDRDAPFASTADDGARVEAVARFEAMAAEVDLGEDVGEVERVAVHPRWTSRGLRLGHRYAMETCYACGDRTWGDYRRTVVVDVPFEHAPPPAWARPAAGETLIGFTEVRSVDVERALGDASSLTR